MADMAASKLQAKGIIRKEEVAIYHYGVDALFTSLLELMSILLLASIVGNLVRKISMQRFMTMRVTLQQELLKKIIY